MASSQATVDFILEQISKAGDVASRKMFGEWAVYRGGTLVALICDDRLFVKPTPGGRALAGDLAEAPPYPGAKPCLLVPGERWDDAEWLVALIRVTAAELPLPRPKRRRTNV